MNKKKIMGGVLAAAITFGATLSGCSLVSTNAETNLKQTVAEVNITQSASFSDAINDEGLSSYTGVVNTAEVSRRDLIAYFLNAGYSYVQSGYSYETVFNMLIESLTETEALAQYATLYLLEEIRTENNMTSSSVLEAYNASDDDCETETEKTIARYEWLLERTENMGSGINRVNLATYSLYYSINSSIDSYEEEYIKEDDDDDTSGSDSRTTPTGVDTEIDDYYPAKDDEEKSLNYGIYTGYTGYTIEKSGAYEDDRLDGDTRTLRTYAYNEFIKSLKANYLIEDDEDCTDVLSLSYIQEEYCNQLKSQVIEMYYDIYETELTEVISTDDYLTSRYNELLTQQRVTYSDADSFETALSSMASDSFVLYAPSTTGTEGGTFGFVYNILLPFSQSQSNTLAHYSDLLENGTIDENTYYYQRNQLLKNITTTDQRSAWITGTTDYSFDATDSGLDYYTGGDSTRTYLFFENNLLKTDRYEELENYIGLYSYNGTVTEAEDGSYILTPKKLTIDNMVDEFVNYINYVFETNGKTETASISDKKDSFYDATDFYYKEGEGDTDEINYGNFVYVKGSIGFSEDSKKIANLFVDNSSQYLALSAVNELQYAYTTDTSVLSQYIGYSVSAYDTSYIKEFEAAAKEAISEGGAGTFYVLAGDYGWHIIYVTATFDTNGGEIYDLTYYTDENGKRLIDWSAKTDDTKIGSFEYLFYEYIKESDLNSATTNRRSQLIAWLVDDDSVVLYEDAYSDLLELDS